LTRSLGFDVSDTARKVDVIHNFALALAELDFLFQLMLLEGKPFSDLLAPEGNLAGTVANIEDGRWVFGLDFASNAECPTARGGYGTTGFVTARQSAAI
jgi:hypothetical protein